MDGIDPGLLALTSALTLGITQVLKGTGERPLIDPRWAGLAALVTGVVVGTLLGWAGVGDGNAAMAAVTGAVAGLMASGAWSGTKSALDR